MEREEREGSLTGRYIHLAGSAGRDSERAVLARCHAFVRELVKGVLRVGGGFVLGIGDDERIDEGDADSAVLFDWTVIDEIERAMAPRDAPGQPPSAIIITSQKNLDRIPLQRRARWKALVDAGPISVRPKSPSWNAGAYIRQHQAAAGHGLVILGAEKGWSTSRRSTSAGVTRSFRSMPIFGPTGETGWVAPRDCIGWRGPGRSGSSSRERSGSPTCSR